MMETRIDDGDRGRAWSRRALLAHAPRVAVGALALARAAGLSPVGADAAAPPTSSALRRVAILKSPQGFAGQCAFMSVGGKSVLVMANNESDYMNQISIDATAPAAPLLLAESAAFQYCWGVGAAGSLLAFVSSASARVGVYNPTTLAQTWERSVPAQAHAVATDGNNVFLAQEGADSFLVLRGTTGATLGTAALRGGTFGKIYGTVYAAGHAYVADPRLGVVIFDVSTPSAPAYVTRFGPGTSNIAVNKTRVWVVPDPTPSGSSLQCWDVSAPASPRQIGTATVPPRQDNGTTIQPTLFVPASNAAGTRLYVVFKELTNGGGRNLWNTTGFYVFDVSGPAPRYVNRFAYQFPNGAYPDALGIAVDAAGSTVALTNYDYGLELWQASGDAWRLASLVPTVGECRDVYVDASGNQIALGRWIVTSKTATGQVSYYNEMGFLFEGWRPYVRGTILVMDSNTGNGFPRVYSSVNGQLTKLGQAALGGGQVTDVAYDGADYVYACSKSSGLTSGRVSPSSPTNVAQLGALAIGAERITLNGRSEAWVVGPTLGVARVDVGNPSAMAMAFHDTEAFTENGMCGICVAAGRVYAACGSTGVRIYNPHALRRTGAITTDPYSGKIFATWVEPYTSPATQKTYLVVCHYGDGLSYNPPEGIRIYSLANPDAPALVVAYPASGDANFRCRVANGQLYRCALWGVEQLAVNGL